MEPKEYSKPEIVYELWLETEAGSPRPKGGISDEQYLDVSDGLM